MDILYNNNLINQIVDKLFKNKRSDYSEFNLQSLLYVTDINHQEIKVSNQNYEKIHVSLFKKSKNPQICIVFMHGYGSNRLECTNILRALPDHYAVCAFDFSGSGKSEGDLVTYGMKEKEDINSILNHLRQGEFKKFVLWGRSMGATSALLYCLKYNPQDVALQIIDSPFYSFEMIAFQIANKNVKAPEFIISFALQLAKKNCSKFQYNPFDIELKDIGKCTVPALFLYSQDDNVINCQNTHLITNKYKAYFEKLVIHENHNTVRSQATIEKIFSFIEKYSRKAKPKVTPTLLNYNYFQPSVKNESTPTRKVYSRGQKSVDQFSQNKSSTRKGIERVHAQQEKKRFDDYGIWVASRFTKQMVSTPQSTISKRKSDSAKKPHLSLSNSFVTKHLRSMQSVSPTFFNQQLSKEPSSIYQFNARTMASQKEKSNKKISTVKSLGVSRCLNNSKYL